MRRLFIILAILGTISSALACAASNDAPSAGQEPPGTATAAAVDGKAPGITATTYDGSEFSLEQLTGRPVVINFWFPSCPPCATELPDLQAAFGMYGDRVEFVGVQLLGVDSAESGRQFLAEKGVTYRSFADEKNAVQKAYNVLYYPTTIFLDRDHRIVKTWAGLINSEQIDKNISAILGA